MRIDLGAEEQPEIGLIALIDCIFFLLMFFMVATTFKHKEQTEKQKNLPVVLPRSAVSFDAAAAGAAPLVIGVDQHGGLYAEGKLVTAPQLQAYLRAAAARDPAQRVRIDGDRHTPYQDIVRVLDFCQFEGLTNLSMHARD
jgi:biopolymer transport protein ExbD